MKSTFRIAGKLLKVSLLEKNNSFWVILYPMLLMTFIYLGFSGIKSGEFEGVRLGVSPGNEITAVLNQIEIVHYQEMPENQAKEELEKDKIDAYIQPDLNLLIKSGGAPQAIAQSIVTEYKQTKALGLKALLVLGERGKLYSRSSVDDDILSTFFYNIVGMFSLYGYFVSTYYTGYYKADTSYLAQRHCFSPMSKFKGVMAGILASMATIILSMTLLLCLSQFVLKINLIRRFWPSMAILSGGMVFGICAGMFVGALKLKEWVKTFIGIGGSLILAFLSGLMNDGVRNAILRTAPIVLKLNPVYLLMNGFYRVNVLGYVHEGLSVLITLAVYSALFTIGAVLILRKNSFKEI